jgi:DNA-binding PadR family transcriptional regulator
MRGRTLAPGEWAVLALLCEQPAHGWALAGHLARSGELGSVWSLGRPLVYRSLEILQQRGLIEAAGYEPGARGPNRMIFRPTQEGRAALERWLEEPVDHIREARSLLLLKLVVAERGGFDPEPMLSAQHDSIAAAIESLEGKTSVSDGSERILLRFRLESSRAVLRFIEAVLAERVPPAAARAL